MKKRNISLLLIAFVTALACMALAGCSGSNSTNQGGNQGESGQGNEQSYTLDSVQVEWNGYTMGFELVSDDPERAQVAGIDFEGKPLKVCFKYISDAKNSGGFVSETMLNDLAEKSIVLKDASGETVNYTGAMGDFKMKGNFASDGFAMEELQPRFSITFDVPADAKVEDYVLLTGDGQEIKLMTYISDAYSADISK